MCADRRPICLAACSDFSSDLRGIVGVVAFEDRDEELLKPRPFVPLACKSAISFGEAFVSLPKMVFVCARA
jgi:hypothetical protein